MAKPDTNAVAVTAAAQEAEPPISRSEFLAVVQQLALTQQLTHELIATLAARPVAVESATSDARIAAIATQATIDAYDRVSGKNWDITKFPKKSVFNPAGEKDHPRPTIRGEVYWLGFLLSEVECTLDEIELINRLEPGMYHEGRWVVRDLQPGVSSRDRRKILVIFPCSPDQIMMLPRSMSEMLREMLAETATPVLTSAGEVWNEMQDATA